MSSKDSVTTLKLIPMSRTEAAALVERLLGSYPSVNLHDPEVYVAEIVTLLSGYPLWAGEQTMEKIKKISKFVPTIADLHPELEAAVKPFRYAAEWEARSQHQLLEDLRGSEETPEHRAAVVERIRKEMAANGMPILGDKKSDYDPQFTEEAVKKKFNISDEQWNQIPDADPGHWQRLQERHRPNQKGR